MRLLHRGGEMRRHMDGVVDVVLDDGTVTAWAEREEMRVRCPVCRGGEGQADCGPCAGRGVVDHVPYPERPWDEIIPNLYIGGHCCQQQHTVKVGREFALVVSLHQEPEGAAVYGPGWGIPHISHRMADADLDPAHYTMLDHMAERIVAMLRLDQKVLVRCMAGINRSALVAGLAMLKMGYRADDAIEMMRAKRSPYNLCNESFVAYLHEREGTTPREDTR